MRIESRCDHHLYGTIDDQATNPSRPTQSKVETANISSHRCIIFRTTMPPFSEAPPSPEHPFLRSGDENQVPAAAHQQAKDSLTEIELSPRSVVEHPIGSRQQPSPESTWLRSLTQQRIYQQWKTPSSPHCDSGTTLKGILKRHSGSITQKTVTFSANGPHTRIIPNISIANDPELALAVWYSKQGYRDMKEHCELLLDFLHLGVVKPYNANQEAEDDEEYNSIGFESCFGEGREVAEALQIGGRAAGE